MVIIMTVLTCGLYHLYFSYMAGKRLYYMQEDANLHVNDNSVLHLLLCIGSYFVPGAFIISYAILQSDINRILEVRGHASYY